MQVNAAQYGFSPFVPGSQPLPPRNGEGDFSDLFPTTGKAEVDAETAKFKEAMSKKGFNNYDVERALTDYRQWLKKNPNASDSQRLMARRAAVVRAYWKELSGDSKFVTVDSLTKRGAENPNLPQFVRDAASYFAHPGNFRRVDQAGTNATIPLDGHASQSNFEDFLTNLDGSALKSTADFQDQLDAQIELELRNGGVKLTDEQRKDILKNPDRYTVEQKALALMELERTRDRLKTMISQGYGARDVSVLDNFNLEIEKLNKDPAVKKKRNEMQKAAAKKVLKDDADLQTALETRYALRLKEITSGDVIRYKSGTKEIDFDATLNDPEALYLSGVLGKDHKALDTAYDTGLKAAMAKDSGFAKALEARYEAKKKDVLAGKHIEWDNSKTLDENIEALMKAGTETSYLGKLLNKDPQEMVEARFKGMKAFLEVNSTVKDKLQKHFDKLQSDISSGDNLKWDDSKDVPTNLKLWQEHNKQAFDLAQILGHGFDKLGFDQGLKLANGGKRLDAAVAYFKDQYASGARMVSLKTGHKGDAIKAAAEFASELTLFERMIGKDPRIEGADLRRARSYALGDVLPKPTLGQLQEVLADANGKLDTAKVEALYDAILAENPDAFRNSAGEVSKAQYVQICAELWAFARETAKTKDTPVDFGDLFRNEKVGKVADWMNKGFGHVVMGLLGGIACTVHGAMGNYAGTGRDTLRAVASATVAFSDVLEGMFRLGAGERTHETGASMINPQGSSEAEVARRARYAKAERFFKGLGAAGNGVLGVVSLFDASDAFARGEHTRGALSVVGGSLSLIDAGVTMAEVFFSRQGGRLLSGMVGVSGAVGALWFAVDTVVDYVTKALFEDDAQREIKASAARYGISLAPDKGVERNAQRAEEIQESSGLMGDAPGAGPRGGGQMQE